jgi:N6-L-threonylcarbamoyladenine synthase
MRERLGEREIAAIGVSTRPRNVDGSYMPCFLSGVAAAESIAAALGVPLYEFSHQCGHITAAIYSSGKLDLLDAEFGAFHVSGGTTELLRVSPAKNGFLAEKIGGTKDLNAGQVIDRIGVMLGLTFPCGRAMEELALKNTQPIPKKKISSDGLYVNLSGLENMAEKLYKSSSDASLVAAFVLDYIGRSISAMSEGYVSAFGPGPIVYAGGVMSNSIIKNMLSGKFEAYFAEPALSADNAVGVAYLARERHAGK